MFCYQCEQTAKGTGCTVAGVCGKDARTAAMQDLLVHALKGIAAYAHPAAQSGSVDPAIDHFLIEALFTTVTNVNFDAERIAGLIGEAGRMKERAEALYRASGKAPDLPIQGPMAWRPAGTFEALLKQAEEDQIGKKAAAQGQEIAGLYALNLYGLKGMAAYVHHAKVLCYEDASIYAFIREVLAFLADDTHGTDELVAMALRCGEANIRVMEMLDRANTDTYGHPVPTKVRVTPLRGRAILVSGHDLKDLEELLKQTAGRGLNVYTHGEMLPAHGYPGLKKYPHLAGNHGGAWQDQNREFAAFPGAILMTTNCIQKPAETYKYRIFSSGLVGWPGVKHITDRNFAPVIEAALAEAGFSADEPEKTITVGFARQAVLGAADHVIRAVKAGKIRRFFLIGGCDGAKPGRNYFTELAQMIPADCVILTLACGKYRFNKLDFGEIDGLPRLLDVGQCNDAYSAVRIALALADAFHTDVNSLPLSLVLSWYEQKAVAILLSLLYLGVRNIRLGPSLPAFVAPAVLDILHEKFNLMPITTPEQDLKAMLG